MAEERRTGRLRPVVAAASAVFAVLVAAAVIAGVAAGREDPADHFVTRSGTTLEVDGENFRFTGFNLYDAAASDVYSCSPSTRLDDKELREALGSIRESGGTVVRFWAYQTYTDGGTDFSGTDRLIDAARAEGLRVLPVLEDGPGNCSTGESGRPLSSVSDDTWYSEGYRLPLGTAAVPYREYVARIAAHYRHEPAVLAWSLVNEAETQRREADGTSALVGFARDVSAVVRRVDPNHLITVGTQSNGAPGASGADFTDLYGLPDVDLTEVHDWGTWGADDQAMPGAGSDGDLPQADECQPPDSPIACSFVLAAQLGKPLVVGEAGIAATDAAERTRRANWFAAKIDAAFRAGAAGYLVWQLNRLNTDGYAVVVGAEDPLVQVLRQAATRWSTSP